MPPPSPSIPTPLATSRGTIRVCVDGDAAAPALILSNSLGTTLEMWDPQVEALSKSHRLIRYDTRGHGGSPVTPGPYRFDDLGQDVLAVLDALHIEQAAFCGLSMGGTLASGWVSTRASASRAWWCATVRPGSVRRRAGMSAPPCCVTARMRPWRPWLSRPRAAGSARSSFRPTRPRCEMPKPGWRAWRRKAMPPAARLWPRPICVPTCIASPHPPCCWRAHPTRSRPWPMHRPCKRPLLALGWRWCPRLTFPTSKHRRHSIKRFFSFLQPWNKLPDL